MNKERVKGTIDEIVGTLKRKAGEWTGDTPLQVRGIGQQAKGRLEKILSKTKNVVYEADNNLAPHAEAELERSAADVKDPKRH